jgi:hypothetical protein
MQCIMDALAPALVWLDPVLTQLYALGTQLAELREFRRVQQTAVGRDRHELQTTMQRLTVARTERNILRRQQLQSGPALATPAGRGSMAAH